MKQLLFKLLLGLVVSIPLRSHAEDATQTKLDSFVVDAEESFVVPAGTTREEYYHHREKWHIVHPFLFRFSRVSKNDLIFDFKHSEATDHAFWGFDLTGTSLQPRFPTFEYRERGEWKAYPIGYCGTGQTAYLLRSGRKYHVRLWLPEALQGKDVRISLQTGCGVVFTSEPFNIPSGKKLRNQGG